MAGLMENIMLENLPHANAAAPPTTSIQDLLSGDSKAEQAFVAILGNNMGRPTLSITLPLTSAIERTTVFNDPESEERAQRELNLPHAHGLAQFHLHGAVQAAMRDPSIKGTEVEAALQSLAEAMGPQEVFATSPWTANVRGINPNNLSTLKASVLAGSPTDQPMVLRVFFDKALWSLLDAQHRRKGGEFAYEFMRFVSSWGSYPTTKSGIKGYFALKGTVAVDHRKAWAAALAAFERMTVNIDLHLGLNVEGERQVFADLNNKSRKVDASLSYEFDTANPILNFIQERLADLISEKLSRADLVSVNAIAFLNKTNVKGAVPLIVSNRSETVKAMWDTIESQEGFGEPADSVINQVVVQKAIAKLVYDFGFSRTSDDAERLANNEHLQTLLANLDNVDFGHQNPVWRYYGDIAPGSKAKLNSSGIEAYLMRAEDGSVASKDLGTFADGKFTFSVKHNDVYPVIADLLRFQLGLPPKDR